MANEKADKQIRIYGREGKILKRMLKAKQENAPQAVIADVVRDLTAPEVEAFLRLSLKDKALAIEGAKSLADLVP